MLTGNRTVLNVLLYGFVVLDLVYAVTCFFFPEVWFQTLHGADYVDPQGLLRRTGALWAAFALFQLVAALRWSSAPYWLAVVAGMRLSELFADWTYLYFAGSVTGLGRLGLLLSTPFNLLVCLYLLGSYLKLRPPAAGTPNPP
ncbi:hypothetical protein GQ464_007745 [Rhodocaloribacter litoris]|uniref:hypothetical protein n=1 Tax=Rhodocaloribacter litoris TaxID=2558931 RepID=UPI001422EC88|nr:hypothetical protein [Rhodocaloribacter litoris]QXD16820.1 hypothetical protein GQ464_007745 [Rhodocaloribacter litoris]GIV60543.1 MAG: hypothetical protein KatS3mg043_1632 [Rhodothermaceae bacterium]